MKLFKAHTWLSLILTAAMLGAPYVARAQQVDLAKQVKGVLPAANGGTALAYFAAAGPTAKRTFTFPDADATILYSGGALGTPASGTATNLTGTATALSIGGNAATATALAADPTDCSANQFANAIAASGNLTCAQPSAANLSNGVNGSGSVVLTTNPLIPTLGLGIRAQATSTDRISVTGATTIFSPSLGGSSVGSTAATLWCNGYRTDATTNSFWDEIHYIPGIAPVVVAAAAVARGSPAVRTYTNSGTNLQLAMAANTYNVACVSLEQAN